MANVSVTASCNRECDYCFAMDFLEARDEDAKAMTIEMFERVLDFHERSGMREARLLGGEPTTHPQFGELLERVFRRGLDVMVFSGGLIPPRALAALLEAPADRCSVLVNVIAPGYGSKAEMDKQARVFDALGRRAVPGINIDSPATPLDFLLDLIEKHDSSRTVRLGLAHPVLGGSNDFLHTRHYDEVGRRVTAFGLRAAAVGVELSFDCGWVPCMFPPGAMDALGLDELDIGLRCSPILDVMPDGATISCYPLANHADRPLDDEVDASTLRNEFERLQAADRSIMLFQKCDGCSWRAEGKCTGGCLSGSLKRLRSAEFEIGWPRDRAVSPAVGAEVSDSSSMSLPILSHGPLSTDGSTGGCSR